VQDVTIPALGMAMTESLLTRWHKQPGQRVRAGEPVAEIETDKATVDLESPCDGVLGTHLADVGDRVAVSAPVCRILQDGEAELITSSLSPVEEAAAASPQAPLADGIADQITEAARAAASEPVTGMAQRRTPHSMSPRQRRFARLAADGGDSVAHGRREAIAARVSESWRTIPHFAVARDVEAAAAVAALQTARTTVGQASMTDLLLHAFAVAVATLPGVSSTAVGLAVATPDGVMTPVVREAASLRLAELADARRDAARRARDGRLAAHDLDAEPAGTLSNLGTMGVDSFTGIIPLGQLCLLTVGRVRPVVAAVHGHPVVRDSVHVTLNVDHRHVDGDVAARALQSFVDSFTDGAGWPGGDVDG
jgi:pyruvate dehydrogenase E2 component (dihydrolipoamide acetyltransferase)